MTSSQRRFLRAQIRRAKKGDRRAFLTVAAPYLNFIGEYLALSGYAFQADTRKKQTFHLLRSAWRTLPFLHRVSDVERVITQLLFQIPDDQDPILVNDTYLPKLHPTERLAIVAQDFEDWGYNWGALALRKDPATFGKILCEARCHLVGIYQAHKTGTTIPTVERSSVALDCVHTHPRRKFRRSLPSDPSAAQFKARWLEFRGHFIEFRQEVRFSEEEQMQMLEELLNHLHCEEMNRPPLLDKLATLVAYGDQGLTTLQRG